MIKTISVPVYQVLWTPEESNDFDTFNMTIKIRYDGMKKNYVIIVKNVTFITN